MYSPIPIYNRPITTYSCKFEKNFLFHGSRAIASAIASVFRSVSKSNIGVVADHNRSKVTSTSDELSSALTSLKIKHATYKLIVIVT